MLKSKETTIQLRQQIRITPWCLTIIMIAAIELFGQSPQNRNQLTGIILDPDGAVISDAVVTLRVDDGGAEKTTLSDLQGRFRFQLPIPGGFMIEVKKNGFESVALNFESGEAAQTPIRVVMSLAGVREELVVAGTDNQVSVDPEENLNVLRLERSELKKLPVLGNDVIGELSSMIDGSSIGTGGATVIIDGIESTDLKIPASQIQEVRINQNPYSAEFRRPGRGRLEVITKAGTSEYHGEFNFVFRDYHLDARNAFASIRPPEQRRIYEGNLTGPLGGKGKTSFLLGLSREEEDLQSIVYAGTPAGIVSRNIDNPARDTEIDFRINHEISDKTTISIRYEHTLESSRNDGVGGFNLPELATNGSERDNELHFTHRRIVSSQLINEFSLRFENERSSGLAASDAPRIVVLEAFSGGGSQVFRRASENNLQLNEIVSWTKGRHFIRGGLNISNLNRRGLNDRTNFGGTFTFSTLDDYVNNRPFLFSVNQGESRLVFWQKDFGFFAQDDYRIRSNFSIGLGLRYDRQNFIGDRNNFGPRFSFAYAPGGLPNTVIRGGAGIFYDRTGGGPISDTLRFDGQRVQQVIISNPGYPDPFSGGEQLTGQPLSITRFATGIRSPYTIQYNAGIERQLLKSLTLTASYIHTRSVKLFRSRNLNAPLAPGLDRPDPMIGVLRQIESSGHSRAHALELVLRGRLSRFFNGTIQYTLGRANDDTGGIDSLPANNYDLSPEWSRADYDRRHRFELTGSIKAGDWFDLGMRLSLNSGRPYSLTTGRDDNNDTVANDRPAETRRNTEQGPGSAVLNLRWSKEFELSRSSKGDGPVITIGVDAFNVLNRTNFSGFIGNLSSPFFGLPVSSRPARRIQLSFGFEF